MYSNNYGYVYNPVRNHSFSANTVAGTFTYDVVDSPENEEIPACIWGAVKKVGVIGEAVTTNLYVWGHDLSGSMQNAGGIGGLLSATFNSTSTVFYCFDGNGNVTDLASQNGSVVASYQYDPFGKLISATGDAGILAANNYLFSTKYQDPGTGLLYYGYRYLDPELGRWMSRDPMEELGGETLYGFCINRPTIARDALGLYDEIEEGKLPNWPDWPADWDVVDYGPEKGEVRFRVREITTESVGWDRGKRLGDKPETSVAYFQFAWEDECCYCQYWEEVTDIGHRIVKTDWQIQEQVRLKRDAKMWKTIKTLNMSKFIREAWKAPIKSASTELFQLLTKLDIETLEEFEITGGWVHGNRTISQPGTYNEVLIGTQFRWHYWPIRPKEKVTSGPTYIPLTKEECEKKKTFHDALMKDRLTTRVGRYTIHNSEEQGYMTFPQGLVPNTK